VARVVFFGVVEVESGEESVPLAPVTGAAAFALLTGVVEAVTTGTLGELASPPRTAVARVVFFFGVVEAVTTGTLGETIASPAKAAVARVVFFGVVEVESGEESVPLAPVTGAAAFAFFTGVVEAVTTGTLSELARVVFFGVAVLTGPAATTRFASFSRVVATGVTRMVGTTGPGTVALAPGAKAGECLVLHV
jgi:hypothetical protein